MKTFSILKLSVFFIASTIISSCQKENRPGKNYNDISEEHSAKLVKLLPFKGTFSTTFNFVPDIAGGWTSPNPAPAWYPGVGSGNLTHIGTCLTYFNQYASFGAAGLQSVAAPVNLFFSVPLGVAGITVPNTVSTIYYTAHGQSVWSTAIGISVTTPVSPTRIEFTANHEIIGGTGRFANATGQYKVSGFFNPQNPEDAGFEVDGFIEY